MTARLVNTYQPDRLALCLDGDWRPSWRVELFPDYKANRLDEEGEGEEEPDLLTPQIPTILDFFEAIGIQIIGADDYEADDVIATLSRRESGPIRIVTGDRDLFQLVDDDNDVKVVYLAKGISAHDLVDRDWITTKYGIPGDRYSLFAQIRGDASDGLPGIKGIGEKGAAELANLFSDMNEILEAVSQNDSKMKELHRKRIAADLDYARIAEQLVSCALDVPLPQVSFKIPESAGNPGALEKIKEEFGLGTSIERLKSALRWS